MLSRAGAARQSHHESHLRGPNLTLDGLLRTHTRGLGLLRRITRFPFLPSYSEKEAADENQKPFLHSLLRSCLACSPILWLSGCGEPELGSVEVTPEEISLAVGEQSSFKAAALSKKGQPMPAVVFEWTLEGDAGSLDPAGTFTAEKPGEVEVIARTGDIEGRARVTVNPRALAAIQARTDKTHVLAGSTVKVRLQAVSGDGQPAGLPPSGPFLPHGGHPVLRLRRRFSIRPGRPPWKSPLLRSRPRIP